MDEKYYLTYEGLSEYDALIKAFITGRLFIGTTLEYESALANGQLINGAIVVLTDDENVMTTTTTAALGSAILGKMILGLT